MGYNILDDGDSSANIDDPSTLAIDQEYAKRYEHNKKREALQRHEDLKKRGLVDDSDYSDDSSSSDDDEDNPVITGSPNHELKLLRALNKIKKKDPILEQKDVVLFSDDDDDDDASDGEKKPKAAKKEKPLHLKDINAQRLLEEGPETEDDEPPLKHHSKIYKKEQEDDIKAFLQAEKEALASDDDGGDIIKRKEKPEEDEPEDEIALEIHKELDDYFGEDDKLSESDLFLKKFMRDKLWVEKDKDKKPYLDDFDVSEDEEALERQEDFEAKYNFRHEQAENEVQGDRVTGHARFIEGTVRKKDNCRKKQRKSKEERMQRAELERKEELKRIKNIKKEEIRQKLEKIRAVAGLGEDGACKLGRDDLVEEFDPDEYDKKMKETFGDDYYGAQDADPGFGSDGDADMEKPDFDKEDELLGLQKGWDLGESKDGFASSRERFLKQKELEEEEPQEVVEEEPLEEGKRKRKRKIPLKEKVQLDKELDEYYKLDYEDTIGDLKTRFKYREVPASKYDLSVADILMAEDKDLNQYVSMKKLAPYREEEWKVTPHQRMKKDLILGGLPSINKKTKKSKKNPVPEGGEASTEAQGKTTTDGSNDEVNVSSRRSRRRQRQAELRPSQSRLQAYGKIPPKTHKTK